MALQSLILPILSVFRSAGLQQASGVLRSLTGNFSNLAGQIGLAAGSFGAFSALTSARQFTIDSVNATAAFERNLLGLSQVFEGLTPQMVGFTKDVKSYGISQQQAAQASVFLGSVLKQYGFSVAESSNQTQRLVTLAQDLATTYGYDLQEALLAITALFRGEYDPIEKFGVAMKQNEINAIKAARGLGDLTGAAEMQADAQIRLELLFQRANDAVGAFGRATDTLYGSQQLLNAELGNLQVAFGEPLQRPLAAVNNAFAELINTNAPGIIKIGEALGKTIENAVPVIQLLGDAFLRLLQQLPTIINLLAEVVGVFGRIITVTGEAANAIVKFLEDVAAADPGRDRFEGQLEAIEMLEGRVRKLAAEEQRLASAVQTGYNAYGTYNNRLVEVQNEMSRLAYLESNEAEAKRMGLIRQRSTEAWTAIQEEIANATKGIGYYQQELERLGVYSKDAEGNLSGLAAVFADIGMEAEKSKVSQELELMGFNASQIEYFLTRPDWAAIFGEISRLAKIAAIDIASIPSVTGAAAADAMRRDAQKTLDALRNSAFTRSSSGKSATKKAATDTVKDFFDNMQEEIRKQTAREQLRAAKASEGLIDAILGSEAWEKLVARINKGTLSLKGLEEQFRKSAAGIAEYEKRRSEQAAWDERARAIEKALTEELARIAEKAKEAKDSMSELLGSFAILPTIQREVGTFEAQITQMLASIENSLRSAFQNKDILQDGYNALREYARKEFVELQNIGRQRDELAKRYDLAEGLIDNYKKAFTAAFSLTSLFGKLKDETEKRTVTVVTSGIVRLGTSLREFGVTITKSFEEPIAKIQNKSAALLDGFRTMGEKARNFAKNLRELEKMGLNDQLFNELVQAGVEAGGETAQALVDGGSATINEINSLFDEINMIGASLGEEAAATLYGSGINMMDGILAGIRSKQNELENTARTLAEAFNKEFQAKFNIQVGVAEQAARAAAEASAAADLAELGPRPEDLPKPVEIDMAAFSKLDTLIKNATKYSTAVKDATKAAGALTKLEIYKDLQAAVAAGQAVDLTGVRAGLSSAELAAAARQAAPTAITNNFTITPGNRAQQNETVETLKGFVNQNGSLLAFGIR